MKVIAFPFAGGTSLAYRGLANQLRDVAAFETFDPPGHGARMDEEPLCELGLIVDDVVRHMAPQLHGRYALFGHSMGAYVAYLLARRAAREGLELPRVLFVSGASAPSHGVRVKRAALPREDLVRELESMGRYPPHLLADEALSRKLFPIVRADLQAIETYRHDPGPPLPIALVVLHGSEDVVTHGEASAWRDETSGPFEHHVFDDGHFFFVEREPEVAACITRALRAHGGP